MTPNRITRRLTAITIVLVSLAPIPALGQVFVDSQLPGPPPNLRSQGRFNTILLPSEQRFIIRASGLLPSEVREIRFRSGGLSSSGIAPAPNAQIARRFPGYTALFEAVRDPLTPASVPLALERPGPGFHTALAALGQQDPAGNPPPLDTLVPDGAVESETRLILQPEREPVVVPERLPIPRDGQLAEANARLWNTPTPEHLEAMPILERQEYRQPFFPSRFGPNHPLVRAQGQASS